MEQSWNARFDRVWALHIWSEAANLEHAPFKYLSFPSFSHNQHPMLLMGNHLSEACSEPSLGEGGGVAAPRPHPVRTDRPARRGPMATL